MIFLPLSSVNNECVSCYWWLGTLSPEEISLHVPLICQKPITEDENFGHSLAAYTYRYNTNTLTTVPLRYLVSDFDPHLSHSFLSSINKKKTTRKRDEGKKESPHTRIGRKKG